MFCNKLLSLYQTVWSRRICFSLQMTMKDWRKATNKNIPVLSYHFFFSMDLRLGSWISAEFLPSFAVLLPPFSKDFVVFTWVLISSQTLTILSLPWFLWRLDVRIYEGKPVPKPMKSVLTCPFFFQIIFVFIALPTTPAFPIPASIRFAFFAVLLELITTFSWMTAPGLW